MRAASRRDETRGRLLAATAIAYAFVLAADLLVPAGSPYRHDTRMATVLAGAAVFIVSTTRFAIGADAGWMTATPRWAGTAAALGVAGGMALAALASAVGLDAPPSSGMDFTIEECYACDPPWDAAARVLGVVIASGSVAALLAVPVGAVSRRLAP